MPQLFEHASAAVRPGRPRPIRRGLPQPSDELRAKALEVHRRLGRVFGLPIPYFHGS